jgi:basic membrane protein A and related proteins
MTYRVKHSPRSFALLLGLLAFACKDKEPATGGAPPAAKTFKAGVVFDVGGVDDKSFNEGAYRGLMKAKTDMGIEVSQYQPSQPADRKTGLRQLAAKEFDLIIGVGFIFSDEIITMAKDFPNLKFACIDMVDKPDSEIPPNLAAIKFKEEQGSFLVGALAGLMTKTKKLGFVGGMNVPLIHKFEAGYRAGIKHVAPDVEVIVNYAGETPQAFQDPETGKNRATEQYKSGVDIIFHAAGKTGLGVFQAAKEEKKLAVGVDADQWQEAPGHVLTSMIKGVEPGVYSVIKAVKEGQFKSGKQVLGLAENGVGIVYDDNNKSMIPEDVYKKVMAIREEIIAGKIQVPTTR